MYVCKISAYLAYAMITYIIGSLYYLIFTRNIGTPFNDSLNEHQKQIAEQSKLNMNKNTFNGKIITEIKKFSTFFEAEEYHQHYNKKLKQKYGIS